MENVSDLNRIHHDSNIRSFHQWVLGFAPLTFSDWVSVLAAAALFLLANEIIKVFKRSRGRVTT